MQYKLNLREASLVLTVKGKEVIWVSRECNGDNNKKTNVKRQW